VNVKEMGEGKGREEEKEEESKGFARNE